MNSEDEHDRLDLQFDPMDDQGLMPPYHHGHQIIHPAHYSEMHDPSMRQHLPPHNEMQHPHHHHHQHAHPHPHHHHRMAAQQQAQENMQLQQQQRHDQNSKNNVPPDHEDSNAEKEEEQVVEAGHTEVTDSSQNDTPNGDSNPDQSSNAGINDAKVKVSDETTKKIAPGRTETRLKASPIKRFDTKVEIEPTDTNIKAQQSFIQENNPTSDLEKALSAELGRKNSQIEKLKSEVIKLKQFISKRKQTYKRKRKEDGAPTRALSAYNIFVQERFEELAKENEQALMNADKDAPMKRVLPSNLVAKTGHEWRALPEEKKKVYRERAKADKKRYNDAMSKYHPPEKQVNKKRNKTGYNMFFSSHVNELKQNDGGVPSERGSVARLVGNAWKALSTDEKQFYEQQADNLNDNNLLDHENVEELKTTEKTQDEYDPNPGHAAMDPNRMPHAPVVHQPNQHDPRAPYPPPPPPGHYPPYPYPYDYYPPMPPPPGQGQGQGRHPHFPYPPHHYPPPPYAEHPHHQHPPDDL